MTTLTVQASGVTSPDNWTLSAGASKAAAVNAPDDATTSYISSTTTDENVQTFTCTPGLPSGATISQVAIRARARRGGASDAKFVVGYSFTKQGGGTQSGESAEYTSTSSFADFTYTHSGLSANWGSGFTFYARNTQTRAVHLTTLEVEFTYTALVVTPGGLAVGVASGGATVYSHKIVKTVAAGGDDGQETVSTGDMALTGTLLNVNSGFRAMTIFRDLLIPPEAAVSASHLELRLEGVSNGVALTLRGEEEPANLTTTAYDISNRTPTTAVVNWTDGTPDYYVYLESPDLTDVIQEVIDGTGWASGGDIGLFLTYIGTGTNASIDSYESSYPPILVIEWAFGAPEQDIAPGGTAVAAGLGGATVGRGAVSITPSGKAVTAAFGTATVGRGTVGITPSGKAVGVGFGTAAVGLKIAPAGKAVTAVFGSARVANVVAPAGKAVAAGLGGATVGRGTVSLAPAGLAVAAGLGGAVVTTTGALVRPDGLAAAAGFGTAVVGRGTVGIAASGKAVGVTVGAGHLSHGLAAVGTAFNAAIGDATVVQGVVPIAPAGLAVAAGYGTGRLWSHRLELAISEDATETAAGTIIPLATSINVNVDVPHAGFRVVNPALPAAVVVQTAALRLYTNVYDDPALELTCELSAAPAAISATQYDISNRTPTDAAAPWVATDIGGSGYHDSPDFSASVKEVIDLPEWEEGTSDLMVILRDLGEGGWLRAYSVDGGASFRPSLVVVWAWSEATLNIGPLGKAVTAGFGEATLTTGGVGITAEGLAVAVTAGDQVVQGGAIGIAPEGLEVTAGIGELTLVGGLLVIAPEGLAVDAAAGAAALGLWIDPNGLAVTAGLGDVAVGRGAVGITPDGLAVAAAFGGPVVHRGDLIVQAAGLAAAASVGAPTVGRGGVGITADGLAVGAAYGAARVVAVITPEGLAVAVGMGDAAVGLRIDGSGLAVAVAAGGATVGRGAVAIVPEGLAAVAAFGDLLSSTGGVAIAPEGLAVAAGYGTASLAITTQFIRPAGVSLAGLLGVLMVIAATTPDSRIYRVPRRIET